MTLRNGKRVLICSACFTASCWYGEFMCDAAREAGTVVLTVEELRRLGREHPDNWTAKKFLAIYGTPTPDFSLEVAA